eukprot:3939938-Rhodomonas_salina.2
MREVGEAGDGQRAAVECGSPLRSVPLRPRCARTPLRDPLRLAACSVNFARRKSHTQPHAQSLTLIHTLLDTQNAHTHAHIHTSDRGRWEHGEQALPSTL